MTISTDTSTVTARSGITGALLPFCEPRGSFGDHDPVTFGIRDHALVVSVARPSWPIEKREPVALQSLCQGVDRGPRAQLHPKVCVPNELARARRIWNPLDVRSVHQLQPPASGKRQEVGRELLAFILIFQVRPRVEVLLVEGAHQFDVRSPDRDMVELHCVVLAAPSFSSAARAGKPEPTLCRPMIRRAAAHRARREDWYRRWHQRA